MNITLDIMSPDEVKKGADSLEISYGFHDTSFGTCVIAVASRGICFLGFVGEEVGPEAALAQLSKEWSRASLKENPTQIQLLVTDIFNAHNPKSWRLLVKGTDLQLKVWRALLQIPSGMTCNYQEIATLVKYPKAVRAVASQIGRNPVSYLIPCHRVIRKSGQMHGYRWGLPCKKALLAFETSSKTF